LTKAEELDITSSLTETPGRNPGKNNTNKGSKCCSTGFPCRSADQIHRDQLMDYFERACALNGNSQTPHILSEAFKFHTSLAETGSMLFKK